MKECDLKSGVCSKEARAAFFYKAPHKVAKRYNVCPECHRALIESQKNGARK